MQQLQQFKLYDLGAKLHGLFNTRYHGRVADLFAPLTDAQKSLDALIKGDPIDLKFSRLEACKLLAQVSALFEKYFIDKASRQLSFPTGDEKIDPQDLTLVQLALEKFESALAAELSRIVVYPAVQRGIYSSVDLIENAHRALSEKTQNAVPQAAKRELDAAGRAIGFDLGTAAAVHALRAVEIVTAAYYELFAPALTNRNERNLATYIRKLTTLAEEEEGGKLRPDPRLIQMLGQLKDLHRNPLLQTDVTVDTGSAASLFGLAISAITQLADQIAAQKGKGKAEGGEADVGANTVISSILREEAKINEQRTGEEEDEDDVYDFRMSQAS